MVGVDDTATGASSPSPATLLDLGQPRRIHIVGVGGAGMSAIAEVLLGTGHQVTGSDLGTSAALERLVGAGASISLGHDRDNLGEVDAVAHSTAIPADNPELLAARERGVPVLRRAEILTAITRTWHTVAVAGTHGKTTTSAMLTAALRGSGLDPTFIVGGDLTDIGRGAAVGAGTLLVVEADESDGTFVELDADAVVVTNVEPDHLEHYGGFGPLEEAFVRFVEQVGGGPRVVCIDDPGSARLAERVPCVTYGTAASATWRITDPAPTPSGITISVDGPAGSHQLRLAQPGMHNARNATAALAMAVELGAEVEAAVRALCEFGGVGRRFEKRGSAAGVELVDDYAHLPTEVASALAAARSLGHERIVTVFQPHRFSRTEQLWSTFADSFTGTDVLVVSGIYPSGERPRPGITGRLVADAVTASHPDADVRYVETLDEVVELLAAELRAGDLCLTLGAGDLTTVPDRILHRLEAEPR